MQRKWKSAYHNAQQWSFEIDAEEWRNAADNSAVDKFHLRVYDASDSGIFDYMQDDYDTCREQAREKWGVPEDSWQELSA